MIFVELEVKVFAKIVGNYFLDGAINKDNFVLILFYGKKIPFEYIFEVIIHEIGHLLLLEIDNKKCYMESLEKIIRKIEERDIQQALIQELNAIEKSLYNSEIFPSIFVRNKEIIRDRFWGIRKVILEDHPETYHKNCSVLYYQLRQFIGSFLKDFNYYEILKKEDIIKKFMNKRPSKVAYRIARSNFYNSRLHEFVLNLAGGMILEKGVNWDNTPCIDFHSLHDNKIQGYFRVYVPKKILQRSYSRITQVKQKL